MFSTTSHRTMKFITTIMATLLCCYQLSQAETIVLNSGKEIEGQILSKSDKGFSIRVEIAKGIHDVMEIPMSDVKVVRTKPSDLKAYEKIKTLIPTNNRLKEDWYHKQTANLTAPFLEKYPDSEYFENVAIIHDILESERQQIAQGGIKLNGKLIKASEKEADSYHIDAKIAFDDYKVYSKARYYRSALKRFEIIERDFALTTSYWAALEDAKFLLKNYETHLLKLKEEHPALIENQKKISGRLTEDDRKDYLAALAQEEQIHKSRMRKDELSNELWSHVWKGDLKSIESALDVIKSKATSIEKLLATPNKDRKNVDILYRTAHTYIKSGDIVNAEKTMDDLIDAQANKKYVDGLGIAFKKRQKEIQLENQLKRKQRKYRGANLDDQ